MAKRIVVREYARLTTAPLLRNTLDEAQVSPSAFAWLCELMAGYRRSGAQLMQLEGRQCLRLDSHVGVLESPCGQVIEILPKHHEEGDCETASRALLCKLIASLLDTQNREADEAGLQLYRAPLSEWVMRRFLQELEQLVKRGLRFDYQRIEEEQRYLRGQLDVVRQMRQPPGRDHYFQIRHDVFLPNRPENRLLQSALTLVCKVTQDPDNWRLAHELAGMLHELPASRNTEADFKQWRDDRLMAHYQAVKPWCELILYRHMPQAVTGDYRGISLLFPMEKLFEDYVARHLRSRLQTGAHLTVQARRHALCTHQDQPMFRLEPDLLIEQGNTRWVLDTKWKILGSEKKPQDSCYRDAPYGLSSADFYQLFAYGQRYLDGKGELALIYPAHRKFTRPLPSFDFGSGLHLHVVPFDLERDELLLPADSSFPIHAVFPRSAA